MLDRRTLLQTTALVLAATTTTRNATAADGALSADEAFKLKARRTGARTIELMWIAAPGTHLYRDRFSVISDNPHVVISSVELPPARSKYDQVLGQTVAYYEGATVLRVIYKGPAEPFSLVVSAQGCAEAVGICYAPVSRRLPVEGVPA